MLAERWTHWLTVFRPKSNSPIVHVSNRDEQSDPPERRSQAIWQWRIKGRRPLIGDVELCRNQDRFFWLMFTMVSDTQSRLKLSGDDSARNRCVLIPTNLNDRSIRVLPTTAAKAYFLFTVSR
jgi:hypothetical protein